jgi:uncharacterized membrane protein YdjX (TVP38/TMEM64 family)
MFVFIGSFFHFDQQQSREFFAQHSPILSSIIFVVLYVVGTFFIWFGPKDVLRVASLFIFGVVGSTVLVYIGEMLNMVTLFWFSRRLGRPFVEAKMKGRLKEIEESASRTSVPVIFFMKFYPIIPFRFLDLGYGLTKISFLKYAAVSMVAAPVRLYVVQYFLDLMIQFGLMAAKGNWDIFIQRYMDMTYYLVDRPPLFFSLMVYTFSAIIFFAVLMIRRHLRKKSLSQGLAAR